MEKKINLIPTEMAVPARAVKITKIITKISTVATIFLILITLVLTSIFFYYSLEDKKIAGSVEDLKSSISKLEKNEQKLILAKDRLDKITTVQNLKSIDQEIIRYQKFAEAVKSSSGSAITEANLNSKGTEVSLLSFNSESLAQVLVPLSKLLDYKIITLLSLGYNPGTGFISSLLLEAN